MDIQLKGIDQKKHFFEKFQIHCTKERYLQRTLVQDSQLQVNIQSDLPLVEKFLQLNVGLLQLLKDCLHVGHRAALGPETNIPKIVKQA